MNNDRRSFGAQGGRRRGAAYGVEGDQRRSVWHSGELVNLSDRSGVEAIGLHTKLTVRSAAERSVWKGEVVSQQWPRKMS